MLKEEQLLIRCEVKSPGFRKRAADRRSFEIWKDFFYTGKNKVLPDRYCRV